MVMALEVAALLILWKMVVELLMVWGGEKPCQKGLPIFLMFIWRVMAWSNFCGSKICCFCCG